jgi:hypothetical protein
LKEREAVAVVVVVVVVAMEVARCLWILGSREMQFHTEIQNL